MKAESVASDGTDNTLVLAGRERANSGPRTVNKQSDAPAEQDPEAETGSPTEREPADADAGTETGTRAEQQSADREPAARSEQTDAVPEAEPADADAETESSARAEREPAGGERTDAESESGSRTGRAEAVNGAKASAPEAARDSDAGVRAPGADGAAEGDRAAAARETPHRADGGSPAAQPDGSASPADSPGGTAPAQETGDADAAAGLDAGESPSALPDRADGPGDSTSSGAGKSRPRPSWAKDGDGRAGATAPEREENQESPPAAGGAASQQPAKVAGPKPPVTGRAAGADRPPAPTDAPRPQGSGPAAVPTARPRVPAGAPTRPAPQPPLELLAELTNTAAPPETRGRTLARRVKVWTPIVLLLGAAVVGVQMLRPLPAPQLVAAQASYTLDGSTPIPWPAKGQAAVRVAGSGDIGTFGEQRPVPTASVAKVMTAYVVLKGHPLRRNDPGPRIEVDARAVADGTSEHESRIEGLTAGTKFSQQDMLKMLMIPSGNNIARLLARWDTGSDDESAFVAKMNAAARDLGMEDTTYTDPSGLDAGTVSTAVDQLKLAEAVMRDEAFRAVVAMPNATIEGLPKPINNNNDNLLLAPGLSIKGIKTGSSTPAGGTLMWAAYKSVGGDTPLILGTMMDQHVDGPDPNAANSLALVKENSRKVIEAVRSALGQVTVIRKGQPVGHVSDGLGGTTPLVAAKDLAVAGVPGQRLRLTLGAGARPVPHGAGAGTEVGVLTVGEGSGAKSVPVAVRTDLREPSFGARITRLS